MSEKFSWVRRLSQFGTRVHTRFQGVLVGRDALGNAYYRGRKVPRGGRESRWVLYAGEPEASKVSPEWHIWLHHIAREPLAAQSVFHQFWQKPHQANQTGTKAAYLPDGHALKGGCRAKATGDYQAWKPTDS